MSSCTRVHSYTFPPPCATHINHNLPVHTTTSHPGPAGACRHGQLRTFHVCLCLCANNSLEADFFGKSWNHICLVAQAADVVHTYTAMFQSNLRNLIHASHRRFHIFSTHVRAHTQLLVAPHSLVLCQQSLASQHNGSAPSHQDGAQDQAAARSGGIAQAGLVMVCGGGGCVRVW